MTAGKDVFPGHPSPSVMSAPFGDKEVVRTLTGMGLEAPPRVDLPVLCDVMCDGWASDMTSGLHVAGVLRAPSCPVQLPWVAGHIAKSVSGETCDPHVGKNDFFFPLKAMDNFSPEVEPDSYIIESVGKFFCCKNTLKISQTSLSS